MTNKQEITRNKMRADVVGSLLRPQSLLIAREQFKEKKNK